MALPHSSVNQRISFDEWKKIFPEKKLLQTSRLCWKHFAEEDIVKWKMIGEEFVHQKRWRLKKGAKPKHLLDTAPRTRNIRQPLTPLSTNQVVKKKRYLRSKTITSILVSHVENLVLFSQIIAPHNVAQIQLR
ncbi:uncharacterized protein LOC116922714 [Daphnia magna]|uniref:uncharacterized protein LOC116922714 n=1 Tax=Daphnia magna TaxID=35525 RepID=UPI00140367E1|nr:uncharacterized protein LOC116922714 [Daphnia magna]